MKKAIAKIISSIVFRISKKRYDGVRILEYHRINNIHTKDHMTVSVNEFSKQMEFLHKKGFNTVSFSDLIEWMNDKKELPRKPIIITFDDGYKDNYINALPVLRHFDMKACVFLTAGFIGTRQASPRYPHPVEEDFFLSWEEVVEMMKYGIEFGAHTLTHPQLTKIAPEALKQEIAASKRCIQEYTGVPVRAFCYPKGLYNERVCREVETAGYECACTEFFGTNHKYTNPLLLKRIEISPKDNIFEFEKKLYGAYDGMYKLSKGKPQGENPKSKNSARGGSAFGGQNPNESTKSKSEENRVTSYER